MKQRMRDTLHRVACKEKEPSSPWRAPPLNMQHACHPTRLYIWPRQDTAVRHTVVVNFICMCIESTCWRTAF